MDFNDQPVIVTGGTRGIGRAITTAFLDRGAIVYATFRSNEAAATAFAESLPAEQQPRLKTERLDVAEYEAVEAFFGELRDEGVNPTVLINNAGIRQDQVLALMTDEQWRAVIDANLTGTFYMSRFAVQAMMPERYGRIVNITSPSGEHGFAGQANYAASKAGQVAMTRSLSKEVATRGITVNCVSPGYVETELLGDLAPDKLKEFKAQVPMRRFGKPAEIAHAVLFLASRESAYITGTVLDVTGGL